VKILIGAETYAPDINGAARFAQRLAAGLAGRGHEVHVACASTDGTPRRERADGCTVHRLASTRYPWHASLRFCTPGRTGAAADALVEEIGPDVVHVQAHLVLGRALVGAARRRELPLVATNHFMPENVLGYLPILPRRWHDAASRLTWRDLSAVYSRADVITAPTPRAVELLRDATGLAGEAVSCGVDADRFRAAAAAAPEPRLLFVGRLDPEKRIDELLAALARVETRPRPVLEIVGDGDHRARLERMAADLGLSERVTFHGHVNEPELLAAYARAHIFCMPGIAELQSIATLEAMAAGKPVVAADAMALPHLVRPGENGYLYTPGDVDELAARLTELVGDATLREQMGARSRALVAPHTHRATLDRFEEIYRALGTVPRLAALPRTEPGSPERSGARTEAALAGPARLR